MRATLRLFNLICDLMEESDHVVGSYSDSAFFSWKSAKNLIDYNEIFSYVKCIHTFAPSLKQKFDIQLCRSYSSVTFFVANFRLANFIFANFSCGNFSSNHTPLDWAILCLLGLRVNWEWLYVNVLFSGKQREACPQKTRQIDSVFLPVCDNHVSIIS